MHACIHACMHTYIHTYIHTNPTADLIIGENSEERNVSENVDNGNNRKSNVRHPFQCPVVIIMVIEGGLAIHSLPNALCFFLYTNCRNPGQDQGVSKGEVRERRVEREKK